MTRSRPTVEAEDDPRWQAVLGRSPLADGRFVYAVRTTGIFCRPTCPAARPRVEHVEFFADAARAERAGYRACKRCKPERGMDSPVAALLRAACERLVAQRSASTAEISRELGLSTSYFHRVFRKHLGVTRQAYRRRVLAERARSVLARSDSVTASVYAAGYSSSSRFYANVGPELGMKPSRARRGAPSERIGYALEACSLGHLCIAWTAKGVCNVSIGSDRRALVKDLAIQFPFAHIHHVSSGTAWAREIVRGVDKAVPIAVPLDVRGTAFQVRVWAALQRIPSGQTRTYAQLARELEAPTATRAVAAACAKNKIAVIVPCHRVVRADGSLAGYRWGVARKRELLRRERLDRPIRSPK